jgi:hypothetical protein
MTVELSEVVSVGALLFSAGGAWVILRQTARRGADQGRRIGKIEIELAEMRGVRRARTAAKGIPIAIETDEGDQT